MISLVARQSLSVTARILVLAAVAAPSAGAQSLGLPRPRDQQQRQIVSNIRKIQSQEGPYSADLLDPLMALRLSYEEHGDHDLAVVALEETRRVVRANYGLYSVKEARLIWQEIRDEKASGDAEAAWDREQKLLALIRRHPNELGIVPILQGIAEERRDILSRYRAGLLPPAVILGCYYEKQKQLRQPSVESPGQCLGGSRDDVIGSLFAEARSYYEQAIGVMYRNRRYSSPRLRKLEARLIRTSYLSADYIRRRTWSCCLHRNELSTDYHSVRLSPDYVAGERSYRRLASYNAADSVPLRTRVKTFVETADWDLLFSQKAGTARLDSVVKAYQQAYDLLERRNVAQTSIDEIFAPKIPVVLPTFLRNPLVSKKTPQSSGYGDVAFDINKYGWAKHIELLDTTGKVTRAAKKNLVRLIKRSNFRPRVTDGRVADTSRVVVRYFFN